MIRNLLSVFVVLLRIVLRVITVVVALSGRRLSLRLVVLSVIILILKIVPLVVLTLLCRILRWGTNLKVRTIVPRNGLT